MWKKCEHNGLPIYAVSHFPHLTNQLPVTQVYPVESTDGNYRITGRSVFIQGVVNLQLRVWYKKVKIGILS